MEPDRRRELSAELSSAQKEANEMIRKAAAAIADEAVAAYELARSRRNLAEHRGSISPAHRRSLSSDAIEAAVKRLVPSAQAQVAASGLHPRARALFQRNQGVQPPKPPAAQRATVHARSRGEFDARAARSVAAWAKRSADLLERQAEQRAQQAVGGASRIAAPDFEALHRDLPLARSTLASELRREVASLRRETAAKTNARHNRILEELAQTAAEQQKELEEQQRQRRQQQRQQQLERRAQIGARDALPPRTSSASSRRSAALEAAGSCRPASARPASATTASALATVSSARDGTSRDGRQTLVAQPASSARAVERAEQDGEGEGEGEEGAHSSPSWVAQFLGGAPPDAPPSIMARFLASSLPLPEPAPPPPQQPQRQQPAPQQWPPSLPPPPPRIAAAEATAEVPMAAVAKPAVAAAVARPAAAAVARPAAAAAAVLPTARRTAQGTARALNSEAERGQKIKVHAVFAAVTKGRAAEG